MTIELTRDSGGVGRVDIASTRPVQIAGLFTGKSAHQTLVTIPLLFAVCAKAQSCAAVQALEQAGGVSVSSACTAARKMIVLAETAREHVLRMVLDWPQMLSGSPALDVKPMMGFADHLMQALFAGGAAFHPGAGPVIDGERAGGLIDEFARFVEDELLGEPAAVWLARTDVDAVKMWADETQSIPARLIKTCIEKGWASAGDIAPAFLPDLSPAGLRDAAIPGGGSEIMVPPAWMDAPLESSCLIRQYDQPLIQALVAHCGSGLLTRLTARICELARLPEQMRDLLAECQSERRDGAGTSELEIEFDGFGAGQVQAARGLLVHMALLDHGMVRDYRILAPTEWNFHPQGPAALGLGALRASDEGELKTLAGLLITAIDPCVGYQLRVV